MSMATHGDVLPSAGCCAAAGRLNVRVVAKCVMLVTLSETLLFVKVYFKITLR